MKLGPVLTYKDVDEAKRLIGKKFVYSNCFKSINNFQDCLGIAMDLGLLILNEVREGHGLFYPFRLSSGTVVQFIREVIEEESDPRYEPYDLSDKKVRDSLRGRWYVGKRTGNEYQVYCFYKPRREDGCWEIAPNHSAEDFFESFTWLDGTPCGQLVHAGEGHVEGNASERRVDG